MAVKKAAQPAGPAKPKPKPKPKPRTWNEFLEDVFRRCGRAFIEWACHSLLIFATFAVIQALHYGMTHVLGIPPGKKFFDEVPLEWLVDGADLFLLVGIGIVGVTAAVRSYMGLH